MRNATNLLKTSANVIEASSRVGPLVWIWSVREAGYHWKDVYFGSKLLQALGTIGCSASKLCPASMNFREFAETHDSVILCSPTFQSITFGISSAKPHKSDRRSRLKK